MGILKKKIMRLSVVRMVNYLGPRGVNTERYRKFMAQQWRMERIGIVSAFSMLVGFNYYWWYGRNQQEKWAELTLNIADDSPAKGLLPYEVDSGVHVPAQKEKYAKLNNIQGITG